MQTIRDELQKSLEMTTRVIKGLSIDADVVWEDIEDVYNSSPSTKLFMCDAKFEFVTFETAYCDAVAIDHICSEILEGDFKKALEIIERYKGIVLTEEFLINKN